MPVRRGIATDQLTNVIQVLQLGHKTGHLTVERGEGALREEGELTFTRGYVTHAQSGRLLGQVALNWLQTWGACRFVFVSINTGQTQPIQMSPAWSTQPQLTAVTKVPLLPIPEAKQANSGPLQHAPEPSRTCVAGEGMIKLQQAQLSRLHRHLYLLIDGKRSFTELVRLMNRQPGEVRQLLSDLARIGIVQSQ